MFNVPCYLLDHVLSLLSSCLDFSDLAKQLLNDPLCVVQGFLTLLPGVDLRPDYTPDVVIDNGDGTVEFQDLGVQVQGVGTGLEGNRRDVIKKSVNVSGYP